MKNKIFIYLLLIVLSLFIPSGCEMLSLNDIIRDRTELYTLSYDGNSNTKGIVPSAPQEYAPGEAIQVKGNSGKLEKTGWIFSGWNTASDGSGVTYYEGQTFTMGHWDTTLWALWTMATYSVIYNGNGAEGGTVPVDPNRYAVGEQVTVLDNTGGLVKDSYDFYGWSTQPDEGNYFNPGDTFLMENADVILYARWEFVGFGGESGVGGD